VIRIVSRDQEWTLKHERVTVGEALREIGLGANVVMAVRDRVVLSLDDVLVSGDVVRIMPLIAGGQGILSSIRSRERG